MKDLWKKSLFVLKVDLPVILAVGLFAGLIFLYLLPGFETVMMDRKRNLIREITSSAYSLLNYYHSLESSGSLETDTAKFQAMNAISTIRYGQNLKDYFWITDLHPRMIKHPYRQDLNGQDLTDFRDSKGKAIFVDFVKAAMGSGESYVEYMWQWNDDSTRIVPKLSYVKLFEPWGWIIGTGIYIDDVRTEIRRLELRAFIISAIIGLIIVLLLSVISRQTHRIEQKRKKAEEDLHKSKELYRTLAEAASEGVLIWSENGLQANKTLLSWLGYTEAELRDRHLSGVFITEWGEEPLSAPALYDELTARRFLEGNLKTKNGNLLKSHADFSRIQLNELKAVLAVLRPVKAGVAVHHFQSGKEIFNNISTGFFKIVTSRKNRFIYATEPTVKLLGCSTLNELLSYSFDDFFADPMQLKYFRAAITAKDNIINKEIKLRRKSGDEFHAVINASAVESDNNEPWCEGSLEMMSASSLMLDPAGPDLTRFSSSYVMDAPATLIMRPAVKCSENMPARRVVSVMKENDTQTVVIINKQGEPMGTIDSSTLGLKLSEQGSPETEIFRWMISPPDFISGNAKIYEAFSSLYINKCKSLLVASGENSAAGIITQRELADAFFTAPGMIIKEINQAGSSAALKSIFLRSRKLAVSMILGKADPGSVSLYLSEADDMIYQRSLTLCLDSAGIPPCRFAFILTGSAGRREPTLSTDQDNAIIFEDLHGDKSARAREYFLNLGKMVNELLSEIGYKTCRGGNMAGNQRWCQQLSIWKEYFTEWIKRPGPDELLEVSIYFDFRFCSGDNSLPEELRDYINNDLTTCDIYFHHMTDAWKQFNPSHMLSSSGKTDMKRLLMPLTGIIRLYAIRHRIKGLSTAERIIDLYKGGNIDNNILRDSLAAWKDLSSIRFNHQALSVSQGKEPDNSVDLQAVNPEIRYFTEKAVRSINNLLLKAGTDFYTNII